MPRPKKVQAEDAPRTKADRDALLNKYADFEGIDVVERRFANPIAPGSLPIRLKDEPTHAQDPTGKKRKWYVRWINGEIDGRTAQIRDVMGYVPVRVDELQSADSISGLSPTTDGIVRRGEKGREWLAKMPLELYTEVKRRQRETLNTRQRNAKMVRQDLAEAAGAQLGDEAGTTLEHGLSVEIKRQRTTLADEMDSVGIHD